MQPQSPYPQPGGQPKKKSPLLWGCLGCSGLLVLFLIIGGIGAALTSGGGGEATGGSASESVEPAADGAADDAVEEQEGPVTLEAQAAEFVPSVLADGSDYTSVQVTVTNNGEESVEVNPLLFSITDDSGTKHSTAGGLGMAEGQIDTLTLDAGENATGVVTAKGSFVPASVEFAEGLFGDNTIKASVQ
ncbi:DUF4352 domain-containing protein [Nocardiopsis ansamitocini]|uniref:DUF4352 domain-containing protein n=1 Tax=Nocardiopsis ansamitocini TaxID=1670832 RepID=A0A9W6UJT3_9ACTN|nr:DUF4352 domain-containing protein [Nocardiopsis ansamitocini]GLU49174.1 hypothetical protein Nans01_35250 [Nocardiopsis ansamitocini]